ncbi:MAG: transketolase C-terminal domain-containing protein, partial [bacterium]
HQVTKEDLSELLKGFQRNGRQNEGYEIFKVRGWDYPALVETHLKAASITRKEHVPSIIHVIEITQPQGHSTSGSQERYKSKERLEWEREHDCIKKMREWMIDEGVATANEIDQFENDDKKLVVSIRDKAWQAYITPIRQEMDEVMGIIDEIAIASRNADELAKIKNNLITIPYPWRRDIMAALHQALMATRKENIPAMQKLIDWKKNMETLSEDRYSSTIYSESEQSALKVPEVKPVYSGDSPKIMGFDVLNACFDAALSRDPCVIAFGEDVGKLGDVNQGFKGLQEKYGELRVADTGIRECTIIGQAIGMAMRGLRPIAEVQYLDYLLYALQIISDDLATLHWRTKGGQKAPVIIRTRGHRLEGVWHSGSPMAGVIHFARGMHVLAPRNMVQAAGFYNTLLQSDDPALIVEVLNGYRLKERLPDNIGEFTVPLGVPEVIREGADITIVTYGACCRIVLEAAKDLAKCGVDAEVVDVQTLLPFDLHGVILESLKKTSRIVFVDEDVPGGTTAYMMQEVLEKHGGYSWLDSEPRTIPGKPHRPAYGSDGDYWSKPNVETIFEGVYELMHEADPGKYPLFFK